MSISLEIMLNERIIRFFEKNSHDELIKNHTKKHDKIQIVLYSKNKTKKSKLELDL